MSYVAVLSLVEGTAGQYGRREQRREPLRPCFPFFQCLFQPVGLLLHDPLSLPLNNTVVSAYPGPPPPFLFLTLFFPGFNTCFLLLHIRFSGALAGLLILLFNLFFR